MRSLSLSKPHLLITVGIPGSGKSFFAEHFATTFSAPYIKYETIMTIAGGDSTISNSYAGYMLREMFKTRHTIVFDGPSATREERRSLRELAVSSGYEPLFIWVQTDEDTARSRFIKANRQAGYQNPEGEYKALAARFAPPLAREQPIVVISGKHTYATQAKAVLKNLAASKQMARAEKPHEHTAATVSNKRNIPIR